MQNISHVYALLGRPWIPGLLPAKNVGAEVARKIEHLIHEVEGQAAPPVAGFLEQVAALQRKEAEDIPAGQRSPEQRVSEVTVYVRDTAIVAWVLREAKGECECCGAASPFTKPDGQPYLEVHHLRRLADGGSDTVSNAVAICPNCHRELHYGVDQVSLLEKLYTHVSRLTQE